MKGKYHFSVLRYVFDPLTQEFVNIGLVVYAPQHGFIQTMCTNHYSRVSRMFSSVDGGSFRSVTRFIEEKINALNEKMDKGALFLNSEEKLTTILGRVLPEDDSAIRFQLGGVGITEDPARTLSMLFERYVSRYENPSDGTRRDDEDVWRVFREPLEQKNVISHLAPKKIVAANYEYEFKRAWKNGIYHMYEPVSFDLADSGSILDKANRWLGRATSLADSSESFKLFLLLGGPQEAKLNEAFRKANNILKTMPVEFELIGERDAERFSDEIEAELKQHLSEEER
jgi:hypothetical protein